MEEVNIYQRIINGSSGASAIRDLKQFNLYNDGEISLEECFLAFNRNHKVKSRMRAEESLESFQAWLKGLGYGLSFIHHKP